MPARFIGHPLLFDLFEAVLGSPDRPGESLGLDGSSRIRSASRIALE